MGTKYIRTIEHTIENTIELPKILDPIECKNMIRYLNATDSKELNNYDMQSSFSFFDDSDYQRKN